MSKVSDVKFRTAKALWIGSFCWLLGTLSVFAHGDEPHTTRELLTDWSFEPGIVIGLALSGWLYGRGLRRLWSLGNRHVGVRTWEAACYMMGWLALVLALVSPLHPWGRVLFSAHMTQHEVLMLIAAPLLVMGRPMLVFLKALPQCWARRAAGAGNSRPWQAVWQKITHPFAAWLIHAVVLWGWHIPRLFQATLTNEWVHAAQHMSFLFSALLFWWAVLYGRERMMGFGMAVLYMFTTALHSGLLGALITFAQVIIYPAYASRTGTWGLTPLQDQQLGGLIMWVPAGLVYVVAGLILFAGWLRESERRVLAREAAGSAAESPFRSQA